jgi:hypothetical protein
MSLCLATRQGTPLMPFIRSLNQLSCHGVARDAGDPKSLTLLFNRAVDDEEMRRIQEHVKVWLQGNQPGPSNTKDFYKS